ncbi:unnamed protein product [Adineta ricciae]|uniref:G-protein coupled receptors family 1 profile domain-containing protein n=1 Tax=Adineta ricciae TaxID=249248 RepID=A0A814RYZ6_ADIRI|nr:unnamed protein product [Adineta ricciae]
MNTSSAITDSQVTNIDTIKNYLLSYWGIIYLLIGTIGTSLNLYIFTDRNYRSSSPCIPYLLASTLATLPLMYVSILSRIGIGFRITPFYYIPILCKLQVYIANVSVSLVIWFTIGSCWDRFLSSSRKACVRQMSSHRNSRRTILAITFCISVAYAQIFYCFDGPLVMAAAPCSAKNTPCTTIDTILLFFIQFFAPPLLIFCLGIKIYQNVHQMATISSHQQGHVLNKQKADRSILKMIVFQVIVLLLCSLPIIVFRLYSTATMAISKSNLRRSIENLIFNATLMIFYCDKMCSFYIYTLTSYHFRKILKGFITRMRCINVIVPAES